MVDIKKEHKYKKEQEELLNKLLLILNYNNDYTFYLYDLDNKIELQNSIIGLSMILENIIHQVHVWVLMVKIVKDHI